MHSSMVSTERLMTSSATASLQNFFSTRASPCSSIRSYSVRSWTSPAFMISPQPERMSAVVTVGRNAGSMNVCSGEKKWPTPFLRW